MEDYSNEKILKTIFSNDIPEELEDNLEVENYLHSIKCDKFENLKKQQHSLENQARQLEDETQEIVIKNYKTFLKSTETSRKIFKGFSETSKNLDNLIEKLPDMTEKCNKFMKESLEITAASRLNSLTLKKNSELLEILELPQLMESFINSNDYEDALELAAYVQRLGVKLGHIPVVNNIVKTIESSWHIMLTQLLNELKCDLQLPKCLQVVGYLRRMQAFSTAELKLKFLQTRDNWLKEILSNIPRQDPQYHLTKTIETTRVNLFNIVTQYKAVFDDDVNQEINSTLMFNSWIHEKIEEFLKTLENDLSHSNSTILDINSVLGQCMYFGLSFSRIGFDFRGLMAPIFLKVIVKNLNGSLIKVTRQFEMDMENYTLINKEAPAMRRSQAKIEDEEEENKEPEINNSPPESLLDYQPLAIYCNGLLTIFNELRICSPIAIVNTFAMALQASLETVCKSILKFYKDEQQAFGVKEKENFIKFLSTFAYELIPYVQHCINLLFPPEKVSTYLGINLLTLQKEGLTSLKPQQILEPINHLLPDRSEFINYSTKI